MPHHNNSSTSFLSETNDKGNNVDHDFKLERKDSGLKVIRRFTQFLEKYQLTLIK